MAHSGVPSGWGWLGPAASMGGGWSGGPVGMAVGGSTPWPGPWALAGPALEELEPSGSSWKTSSTLAAWQVEVRTVYLSWLCLCSNMKPILANTMDPHAFATGCSALAAVGGGGLLGPGASCSSSQCMVSCQQAKTQQPKPSSSVAILEHTALFIGASEAHAPTFLEPEAANILYFNQGWFCTKLHKRAYIGWTPKCNSFINQSLYWLSSKWNSFIPIKAFIGWKNEIASSQS